MYGRAKAALGVDPPRGTYRYNPLCFCSEGCGGRYLSKHGTVDPPVCAEIPLVEVDPLAALLGITPVEAAAMRTEARRILAQEHPTSEAELEALRQGFARGNAAVDARTDPSAGTTSM